MYNTVIVLVVVDVFFRNGLLHLELLQKLVLLIMALPLSKIHHAVANDVANDGIIRPRPSQ